MQSLLPAIYPMIKSSYGLSFGQIGLLTFTFQFTASLLQPLVGAMADKTPRPYSLAIGMGFSLLGLLLLAFAASYPALLVAAALIGSGSSVFHPESSRVARMASGGKHGFAQSVFQVGGNLGTSAGPLLAAFVVLPHGQSSVAWFSAAALLGIVVLVNVGHWYKAHGVSRLASAGSTRHVASRHHVALALLVLLMLVFSKFVYLASISSYYTFFTLLLPHANLFWTGVLTVPIGLILASAFPSIVVYAQDLLPGRTGTVAGLFFGLAFGMGSVGAAVLGKLADHIGVVAIFQICAFLPLIGLLAAFLPDLHQSRAQKAT
jgi:FSR family fosmidomycin resistance protein-like MFS transporter